MKDRRWIILIFLLIYSILTRSSLASTPVEVEGLSCMEKKEFLDLLGIEQELSADSLRRGIKRAFLTGLFDDIRIEKKDGLIMIRVKEREIIERIYVKGNFYIPDEDILGIFLLKEGQPMRYDLLEDAKKGLLEYLAKRGFPEAEIRLEIKKKRSRIRLFLHLKEKEPVVIKKIEGPPGLMPFIRLSVDQPYDLILLERDINYIREHYKKEGFINPEVTASFKEGILKFSVNPGIWLKVKFNGNRAISDRELLKLMPFSTQGSITDELIEEAKTGILLAYKKRGYPFASVEVEKSTEADHFYLLFKITESNRYRIKKIILSGNTLPEERLLSIAGLKEKEYYIPENLELALARLKAFYLSLGYRDIKIDEPVLDFDEKTGTLSISIMIQEGQQILIDKIIIKGNIEVDQKKLEQISGLKEAMPFNDTDINDARLRILEFYSSKGYPYAECEVDIVFKNGYADVIFNISEGKKYSFGKTIIRGNLDTSSRVIKRELSYKERTPFNRSSVFETRQRLYRLGLFSDVEIEPVREDSAQDVLITLKESPQGIFEFGIGYGEYERYRGFMDLSYRNLFGMNRQISLRTEVSSLERRFIINYYEPRLFDSRTSLRVIPLYEERKEKNIDTGEILYRLRRYSEKAGIETPVSRNLKFELFHEFSLVNTYNVKPEIVLPKEDTGTLSISSLVPGLIYDTRDNPFDPTKGFLTGGRLKIASEFFGSEVEFLKLTADASTYISLLRRVVLALGIRAGAQWPLGRTDEIPVVERFFLGGRSSVRGFSQDSLGPKINNTPVGGNYFLQTNLELRWYLLKSFSLVAFLDGGNVWLRDESVSLGDLRYSAGMGIRYNTPAGPLRLDYGQKLDREAGESKGEFHFSIGHAF